MKTLADFKGTEGKAWIEKIKSGGDFSHRIYFGLDEVACVCNTNMSEADATLLAASKDLLEACLLHINAVDNKPGDDLGQRAIADAQIKMREAIEKAIK